jgi:hypothetical protein
LSGKLGFLAEAQIPQSSAVCFGRIIQRSHSMMKLICCSKRQQKPIFHCQGGGRLQVSSSGHRGDEDQEDSTGISLYLSFFKEKIDMYH